MCHLVLKILHKHSNKKNKLNNCFSSRTCSFNAFKGKKKQQHITNNPNIHTHKNSQKHWMCSLLAFKTCICFA